MLKSVEKLVPAPPTGLYSPVAPLIEYVIPNSNSHVLCAFFRCFDWSSVENMVWKLDSKLFHFW